jgi:glucan endo-1,3-alpha-glucosidase
MAPVVPTLALILAAASAVEAAPPGRHAPPSVANMLSNVKRNWHSFTSRWYYGDEYGLVSRPLFLESRADQQQRPPDLPQKRALALPTGWSYGGCVTESHLERLLTGTSYHSGVLTTTQCLTQCGRLGFTFGATEYGDEVRLFFYHSVSS